MATLMQDDGTGQSNGTNADPAKWQTEGTSSGGSATYQSEALRVQSGTAGGYSGAARMTISVKSLSVADVDISGTFRHDANEAYPSVCIRATTDTVDFDNGYMLDLRKDTTLVLYKVVSFSGTSIGTASKTISSSTTYGFRFRAVGTSLKARVWTGSEPGTWDISITDSTFTAAGKAGISVGAGDAAVNHAVTFDGILVADTAASGAATQAITAGATADARTNPARANAVQAITAGAAAAGTIIRPPFPQVRLPIRVRLHLGATLGWVDVTDKTRGKDAAPITITRGRTGEGAVTERSTCLLTFDNRTGDLSPRNPSGAWYGILGRNTPLEVSIQEGGPYLRVAATTDGVSTPDSAALSITGDLDLRVDLRADLWPAGIGGSLIGKYKNPSDRGYLLQVDHTGADLLPVLRWATSGGTAVAAAATVALPMDGTGRLALRATLDVDNGAGGWTATFYTASTIAGPWLQLGDQVSDTGVTTVRDSAQPLRVGWTDSATIYPQGLPGRYYAAEVRAGIDGTIVASPDFRAQTAGDAAFTDGQGNVWSLTGTAELSGEHVLFSGEVPEWPPKWDVTGNDAWTTVQASGILRRLQQGVSPLGSTMRRGITSLSPAPVAYWPCEEGQYATSIGSGLDGGYPMQVATTAGLTEGRFETTTDFAASAALPTVEESVWTGVVPAYTATGQTQLRFFFLIPSTGTLALDGALVARMTGTGSITRWDLQYSTVSGGSLRLLGYNGAGTAILTSSYIAFALNGLKVRVSVELTETSGNIGWQVVALQVGATTGLVGSGTVTGQTVGTITQIEINTAKQLGSTTIGHVSLEAAVTSIFDLASQQNAYLGEAAGRRFQRLCAENSITFVAHGDLDGTAAMGYQFPKTLIELLRQCAETDGGLLFEPRDQLALGYRARSSLERQNPAVSLSYTGHQLVGLEPIEDDLSTRNDITVTREGGTSARAVLTSGPLSVLPVPDGIGKYDTAVTLSLATDDAAASQAQWRLHLGTVDEARYPTLAVNLSHPSLTADQGLVHDIISADIGDRLVVTDPPMWVPPEPISQLIQGSRTVLAQFKHLITWNLAPESPYHVAVYGDPLSRYLPDGSTLASGVDSTATTLSVSTPSGPLWSHADGDFDIAVGGERMTVQSITGATTPQSFTVIRSVNGVVKSHLAGADVTLADPVFYSL